MVRKLRNTGDPLDVTQRMDDLQKVLEETEGLAAAYLFGSYGTTDQTPLSDIDLALVFDERCRPMSEQQLDITGQVMRALHEDDVSVTFLNDAPLSFQHKVLAEGRLIALLDEIVHADFVEHTVRRYCDFAVTQQRFFREYDQALVEDYADGAG